MQIRLLSVLILLGMSLAGPIRAEPPPADTPDNRDAARGGTDAPGTAPDSTDMEALDPFVITPEQKAKLDAQRNGEQPAPPPASGPAAPADAAGDDAESEPEGKTQDTSEAPPPSDAAGAADAEPGLHPLIQSFVESRYGREHCSAPSQCDNLVELQCLKTGDGPIYYYNNDNGRLLMTCGRACLNPDPYDERDCKKCPYNPWVECQERLWREEQERLRQARQAELSQLKQKEAERQARASEILQQIEEIEQECDARIRKLQRELDTLE